MRNFFLSPESACRSTTKVREHEAVRTSQHPERQKTQKKEKETKEENKAPTAHSQ
jgi:hypothetical protein